MFIKKADSMAKLSDKIIKAGLQTGIAIVSILFLVSIGTIFIINFRSLYYFDMKYLDIPVASGMGADEIRENYDALIDYNSPFYTGKLRFPTLAMSESGEQHFAEVKHIFNIMYILAAVTFVMLIFIFPRAMKKCGGSMKAAAVMTSGIPVAAALYIVCNFNRAFVLFHGLLFDNDYWIFDAETDPVITMLPEEFFMHCGIGVLLFPVVGGIVLFVVSVIRKKKIGKYDKNL